MGELSVAFSATRPTPLLYDLTGSKGSDSFGRSKMADNARIHAITAIGVDENRVEIKLQDLLVVVGG